MRIKFHGVRGSHPVSTAPARIDEINQSVWTLAQQNPGKSWSDFKSSLADLPRSQHQIWGGNTTCIELKSELSPMPIYFDAGSGITLAGMDKNSGISKEEFYKGSGKVAIFFSHTHWDHIFGLITLEQLYKGNEFHFYGVHKNLSKRLQVLFQEENFPVPFHVVEPNFKFHQIPLHTPIQLGGLNFNHIPQSHPGGSFAYRVSDGKKVFVFATDTELKNIDLPHMTPGSNLYSDADLLVIDAQFSPEEFPTRQGYGHSHIFSAIDFGARERTKRLYLFHQSPYYSDMMLDEQLRRAKEYKEQKYGKALQMEVHLAIEGDEIEV